MYSVQDLADLERQLGLTAVAVLRRGIRLVQNTHAEGGKVQIVAKDGATPWVEVL